MADAANDPESYFIPTHRKKSQSKISPARPMITISIIDSRRCDMCKVHYPD